MTRTVDVEQRRRLLVHRQLLGGGERASRSVLDVASALSLLHSTDPVTPYLSVHARSDASVREVDAAFYDERVLLRHTTIRRTVFAMPVPVAAIAHGAVNRRLVDTLRTQLLGWLEASDEVSEPAAGFLDRTEVAVVDRLIDGGPATGSRLAADVPELAVRFEPAPGKAYSKPMRITSKVLELLAADGRIARARPAGDEITSGAWTWAATADWIPTAFADVPEPQDALVSLLDRYLGAFGPATVTDMAWWTGLPKRSIRVALDALGAEEVELVSVGVASDSASEPGYVLAGDPLEVPEAATSRPQVSLLPGLDSTTMGWKQRAWYVDDRPETGLFDRNGNAGPTIWCDGRVIGAWTQRRDGSIVASIDGSDPVSGEADRLRDWLGDVRVRWRYPTPATKRLDGGAG